MNDIASSFLSAEIKMFGRKAHFSKIIIFADSIQHIKYYVVVYVYTHRNTQIPIHTVYNHTIYVV